MALEIIGAGFGRTGTISLRVALEHLGFVKCHHMMSLQEQRSLAKAWHDVALKGARNWDEIFEGFRATVDWPSTAYYKELMAHYPAARVVLTVRDPDGLPGNAPPWGTLAAIDLATGGIDWQVPFGEYLSHPGLGLGAENVGGPVVTASGLVVVAATPDMKLRAFDARDGAVLWGADLWASGYSTPVVYRAAGRQFVVIAAGGGRLGPPSGSEYVAFALPE